MFSTKKRKADTSPIIVEDATPDGSATARGTSTKKAARHHNKKSLTSFIKKQLASYYHRVKMCKEAYGDTIFTSNFVALECQRYLEEARSMHLPYTADIYVAGSNDCNQMGLAVPEGSNAEKFMPFKNIPGDPVHVAAGSLCNYCLDREGRLYSWGTSDKGMIGRAANVEMDEDVERRAEQVTGFNPSKNAFARIDAANEDSSIMMVAAGGNHALSLSANGAVYVHGCYPHPMESTTWREVPPADFPDKDNTLTERYEGAAPRGYREEPRHVWNLPQLAVKVAAGTSMSAAVLMDGTLVTWGHDGAGELGRGIDDEMRAVHKQYRAAKDEAGKTRYASEMTRLFFTPKPVVYNPPLGEHEVLDVACGQSHTLVVVRNKGDLRTKVYAAGLNQMGQLGLPGSKKRGLENRNILTLVPELEGKDIVKVAAGSLHSVFLDVTGRCIYVCGRGDYGQLGTTDEISDQPNLIQKLAYDENDDYKDLNFHSIAAGDTHTLAVSRTGKLYSWGFNEQGQLGHGDDIDELRPTVVAKVAKKLFVTEVSAGSQHTIMLATKRE